VLDTQLLAGLGMRPLEDRDDLPVIVRREAVQRQMRAALEVGAALGDLVGRDRGIGNAFVRSAPVSSSSARVGDLVHAAAHEQIAGQRAGGRVLDRLVDLELAVARAGLESS
jgi:hypothetical protein